MYWLDSGPGLADMWDVCICLPVCLSVRLYACICLYVCLSVLVYLMYLCLSIYLCILLPGFRYLEEEVTCTFFSTCVSYQENFWFSRFPLEENSVLKFVRTEHNRFKAFKIWLQCPRNDQPYVVRFSTVRSIFVAGRRMEHRAHPSPLV